MRLAHSLLLFPCPALAFFRTLVVTLVVAGANASDAFLAAFNSTPPELLSVPFGLTCGDELEAASPMCGGYVTYDGSGERFAVLRLGKGTQEAVYGLWGDCSDEVEAARTGARADAAAGLHHRMIPEDATLDAAGRCTA